MDDGKRFKVLGLLGHAVVHGRQLATLAEDIALEMQGPADALEAAVLEGLKAVRAGVLERLPALKEQHVLEVEHAIAARLREAFASPEAVAQLVEHTVHGLSSEIEAITARADAEAAEPTTTEATQQGAPEPTAEPATDPIEPPAPVAPPVLNMI